MKLSFRCCFCLLYCAIIIRGESFCSLDGANKNKESCDGKSKYDWRDHVTYDEFDSKYFLSWLKSQFRKVVTFCPSNNDDDPQLVPDALDDALGVFGDVKECEEHQATEWNGAWDKNGLPKGMGILGKLKQDQTNDAGGNGNLLGTDSASEHKCVNLMPGLDQIHASFSSSSSSSLSASGDATATFEYDLSTLQGKLIKPGFFHGKVQISYSNKDLYFLGMYRKGRADGPGWIFPPDWEKSGFVQAFFKEGQIQNYPVILFDKNLSAEVVVGSLNRSIVDGSHFELVSHSRAKITEFGDYQCFKFAKLPKELTEEAVPPSSSSSSSKPLRLPVVIRTVPGQGSIYARSSKTLIFNRIAKTGSQAITELLVQLQELNGVKPVILMMRIEQLLEPPHLVSQFVSTVDNEMKPSAFVRHYNFVDFPAYGAVSNPVYINMVRHPVERLISWFYYWRAAWNIVERKLAFPQEPMPDPEKLKMDFDTCVLTGNADCQYIAGTNIMDYPDHRSQIMAFCGHELYCLEFEGERAFKKAKENVERHYAVVGVLEDLNKTFSVLERVLPDIFLPGVATELYHTNKEVKRRINKNAYKLPVSQKVMEMVRANFTREIEFYEFLKQRLQWQHENL